MGCKFKLILIFFIKLRVTGSRDYSVYMVYVLNYNPDYHYVLLCLLIYILVIQLIWSPVVKYLVKFRSNVYTVDFRSITTTISK